MSRMKKREVEVEFETEKGRARLRHEPVLSDGWHVRIFKKDSYIPLTRRFQTHAEAIQEIREQLL